jgi:transposase
MDVQLKEAFRKRYSKLLPLLRENEQRMVLGSDSEVFGYGGVSLVSELSGVSRPTIIEGKKEINHEIESAALSKVRRPGGGRKKSVDKQSGLKNDLELMMEPITRGHPESVLMWTCVSTRNLAEALQKKGYSISYKIVGRLLTEIGYSLQSNVKGFEASSQHPDRNEQFNYINDLSLSYIKNKEPVISVDTKKKELLGNYKNNGKEYRKKKDAREVNAHDFGTERASPYGIYDIGKDEGFVNVGMSYDTGEFAVDSIAKWWDLVGKVQYPSAKRLLINADGGGSNGSRVKLWKTSLQGFANKTNLEVTVCHFPPGTSKWNKIEHRLFSQISINWKGQPLLDIETVIQLIGAVVTKKGLKVTAMKEERKYEKGIKITDDELERVNLDKHPFHGEWNYTIRPNL